LDTYGEGPDRFGLIHADLHFGNLVHHRGWPRLFDFDDLSFGFLAHDLIHCLYFAESKERPAFREALLEGYAAVRPLPPELDTILPLLRQSFRLRAMGWLTTRSDNPRLRKMSVERIPKLLSEARENAHTIR
jgi:Ser/Thr protein kinase RdoA (MazF antagonist)